jgi:hypothetical protein
MQFVLLFAETEADYARRDRPEDAGPYWGAWTAYIAALREAGVMVGGNGLLPPRAATTVRVRDGKRHVQDGPWADTKEQLGGYVVIEVADVDAAIGWAERSPAATAGSVEIRPVLPPPAS